MGASRDDLAQGARNLIVCVVFTLAGCGGGGGSDSSGGSGGGGGGQQASPPSPYVLEEPVDAARFLAQATFGGTPEDVAALAQEDAAVWLKNQMGVTRTQYLQPLLDQYQTAENIPRDAHSDLAWDAMLTGRDQVRQRMVFALSQILVVGDTSFRNKSEGYAYYLDVLSHNAFGNYRELLEDITYTPVMSEWLTYMRSRKANAAKGQMPDENYAREIMQLFTIGLVELNRDGTPRTDGSGNEIETYTNEDIAGLARVFTGLSQASGWWGGGPQDWYLPLAAYDEYHSEEEKTFLNYTIPAGTPTRQSVDQALDHLFAHPNVAPFISRQLIQRMTAAHPSPAYVDRVAAAFESGRFTSTTGVSFGTGQRGDLEATAAAILLDRTVIGSNRETGSRAGKIREPVLLFTHLVRGAGITNVISSNEVRLRDTSSTSIGLSQHPFRSPSVFNFYRPGYVAVGTESGEQGLTAPEFQVVNDGSKVSYVNFMTDYILDRTATFDHDNNTFEAAFDEEVMMADDIEVLISRLDQIFTFGNMSAATRTRIRNSLAELPINAETSDEDRLKRVRLAMILTVTAPEYIIVY